MFEKPKNVADNCLRLTNFYYKAYSKIFKYFDVTLPIWKLY